MTHRCTRSALTLGLVMALGLLTVGGCEAPVPPSPLEQARASFAAGQWAESIMFSTEAISQHPDDLRAYVLRGRAFRRLGQFEPAITDFTIAIHLNPKNPEFYYLRAEAYKGRADAQKDPGDIALSIDLSDADVKAGQDLDPSYQWAYLYARPDSTSNLPAAAEELSKTLRDSQKESSNESGDLANRPRKRPSAPSEANSHPAFDRSLDELFESDTAQAEPLVDRPAIKDIYGLPVATELNRPIGGLFAPGAFSFVPTAAESGSIRAGATGRPAARRNPSSAELDRPAVGATGRDSRTAQQGRTQRGASNAGSEYYPPQRSLHPFGAASMRPTGVPTEQFDEESSSGESDPGDGNRGSGGRNGAPQDGSANPSATGGRGYGGPLDPYGGYTRSARPQGALTINPYGGSLTPYGTAGAQGAPSRRRGSAPPNADPEGGAVNPYGPLPAAPVPFLEPPGLRYD